MSVTQPATPRHTRPVCIAGMHRSGTSMIARMLNLCGLYLGPEEELLPPHPTNPEGFWENRYLQELNDEILAALAGGWDVPPSLPVDWAADPRLVPLRVRAQLVLGRFEHCDAWGWKDPRNSLTLPFWRELVSDLQVVICLRHPLEVARSLSVRGSSSQTFSLNLWLAYHERLLAATSPDQRVVTHYDAYFSDPAAELRRVAAALGLPASDETIERACAAASPALHHHRLTAQALLVAQAPARVVDLYFQLCAEAGPVYAAAVMRQPPADVEPVQLDETQARALEAFHLTQVRALQEELRQREHQARELEDRIQNLGEQLAERTRGLEAQQAELAATRQQVAWLQEQINQMQNTRAWRLATRYFDLHARLTGGPGGQGAKGA